MPTSYKGQFVKGGKNTRTNNKKTYDAGQGKPHLSGRDLHRREGKELSEAGKGGRNSISDKYLREAINALVSAGAKPENFGSSGAVSDATSIKAQAMQEVEKHIKTHRLKEWTIVDGKKVVKNKSNAGAGGTPDPDYERPIVKRGETRGLQTTLSTNIKEFINNYVQNKLSNPPPTKGKKSGEKGKQVGKDISLPTPGEWKTYQQTGGKVKSERIQQSLDRKALRDKTTSKKSSKSKTEEIAKSSRGDKPIVLKTTKDTALDKKLKEAKELKSIVIKDKEAKYKLSDLSNQDRKIEAVTYASRQAQNKTSNYTITMGANGNMKATLNKGKSDPGGKELKSVQKAYNKALDDKVDGFKRAELLNAQTKKADISMKDKGISTKGLSGNPTAKRDNIPAPTKKETIGKFDEAQNQTKKANKPQTKKALKEAETSLKKDTKLKSEVQADFQKFKNSLSPEQKIKYLGLDKKSTTSSKDGNSLISSAKKLISENKLDFGKVKFKSLEQKNSQIEKVKESLGKVMKQINFKKGKNVKRLSKQMNKYMDFLKTVGLTKIDDIKGFGSIEL